MQRRIQALSVFLLNLLPVALLAQTTAPQTMMSEDGKYALKIDAQHHRIQAIDLPTNSIVREINLHNKEGKLATVSALYRNTQRQSFIVVFKEFAELWELSYKPNSEPVYQGWVHDYQMGEGIADTQLFAARKTALELSLDCFIFDATGNYAAGADPHGKLQIINLDIRRKIAELQFSHPVFPCESSTENTGSTTVLHLKTRDDNQIILIDMKTGKHLTP